MRVSIWALSVFPSAKGERLLSGVVSSVPCTINHFAKSEASSSEVEVPESGQIRLVECLRFETQCDEACMFE